MSEFQIIEKYFRNATGKAGNGVRIGIGDDAAVVAVPEGMHLVLSMDTLVAGVHFHAGMAASDIGYKSLAVNLSDMAAMGAMPAWATMALTLPGIDEAWLKDFMDGFAGLAREFAVDLIGGDLCRGPLSITIQVHGLLPRDTAILRSGARAGDLVYVTGDLGDAGLALRYLQGNTTLSDRDVRHVMNHLQRPTPRIRTGIALRGLASSAIDISDGLLADLGHILELSGAGAVVYAEKLPMSDVLRDQAQETARELALTAGDDYELCFTVAPEKREEVENRLDAICKVTCIGEITDQTGIRCIGADGASITPAGSGYRHF